MTAGVEHQRNDDGGCRVLVTVSALGNLRCLGDGGTDSVRDAGLGELDEPQLDRDARQFAGDALGQGATLGHTGLVTGAMGCDDQRGPTGEWIGHFDSFVSAFFSDPDMRVEWTGGLDR